MSEDPNMRELLEQLHREIEGTQTVDPDERQLLRHLMQDVQDLLNRQGEELPAEHPIGDRLRESMDTFEVSHPSLTLTMGRLLDILSQNGL